MTLLLEDKRLIFVGGKGGVEKSTSSSAIALHLSEMAKQRGLGEKILLFSTDPTHSIGDSFNIKIGDVPIPITDTLDAVEINVDQLMDEFKRQYKDVMVDFVDPANTSQSCSDCGRLVEWILLDKDKEMVRCPFCGLTINIHKNAARNIRNRSPMYQQKLDGIYQRLSPEMKGMINSSERKLRDSIYCWSLDPEDSFTDDDRKRISRDAAARIYAFGEVTSTLGQATSSGQESSLMEDGKFAGTELQAATCRHPSGRSS